MSLEPKRFWILIELEAERRRLGLSYRGIAERIEPRATVQQRRALTLRIYRTLAGDQNDISLYLIDRIADEFGLDLDLIPKAPAKARA
jgi:hypothetical protein